MLYLELGLGRNVNNTTEFEKKKETEKEKNVENEKEKKENLLSYCQKLAKILTDPRCVLEKQIATNSIVIKKSPVFYQTKSKKEKKTQNHYILRGHAAFFSELRNHSSQGHCMNLTVAIVTTH